jgi:hypothetical protein
MRLRGIAVTVVVVAAAAGPVGTAGAVISGTSGAVTKIAPPAAVQQGSGPASNTTMFAWDEQQGVTLASNQRVDITAPGNYESSTSLTIGTITAGTVVDSHFFHSDRVNNGSTPITLTATLTFPTDIVGVIVTRGKLGTSNVLGAPGTDYSTSQLNNDLELSTTGDGVFVPNMRTVTIRATTSNDLDEVRILTRHNAPPVADAGGPYAGTEGGTVTLQGAASDPEGDAFNTSWSFATTAAPGTVCTPTNTGGLTPAITCNDDALVTATLSVADPYHEATTSTAQITFGNNPPSLGTLTVPPGEVALSTPVNVSAAFSDVGTNDSHTATVDWGDTTASAATVTEANGSGTVDATHTYPVHGLFTVTVTLTDDDGGTATRTAVVDVNGPPAADAGGPYTGSEGAVTGLTGTASDPENDPLTVGWTITPAVQDPGTTCTTAGTSTLTPTVTCDDDAVLNADLGASDGVNPPTISSTTVTVTNAAPLMGAVSATAGPVPVGGTVSVTAPFSDTGTNDTHTASINWGDLATTPATITETNGSGSLHASHVYAVAGLYTVTVTLTDDNGGTDVRTAQVLVNTPPTVDAGGPYAGLEGSPLVLHATAADTDGDALEYSWSYTFTAGPGASCEEIGVGTATPTLTLRCDDDATVTATVTVTDGVNAPVQDTATLTVGNVTPNAGTVVQSATAPAGSTVAITLPFTDAGTNDTHVATVDWGDGNTSPASVTGNAAAGTVSAAHAYATDGNYTVTVVIEDDDGASIGASAAVVSDTTPPEIAPDVQPPPNGAGWNNSPVTVTWTVTDSLSEITDSTGCDPATRSTNTPVPGVTYTCTATSRGGTASASAVVKLDQVAPTLTGAPTTTPNANGWYNAPVTIDWTCDDALSGVAGPCPDDAVLASEGAAVSAAASVSDVAGNTTNAVSAPVKIDTHAPATSASTLPEWSNASVTLALTATDNLSGVDTTQFRVNGGAVQTGTSVLLTDEGIHTVEFWSVDKAGNTETANAVTVKLDKTAPSIATSQSPEANAADWNNTNVTVTFTCADTLSGIASCTGPQLVTTEGAGQVVAGTAVDNAGNSASASRTVNVDKTAPLLEGTATPPNANGWHNAPVTVTWSCTDALSGVATCPDAHTFTQDGANQYVSGTASDISGNERSVTVAGINLDQTPPTIAASLDPAPNLAGWNNSAVTVHFTCTDATSGITPGTCPADQVVTAEGVTTVSGSVTDLAGNSATTSVTISVDTIAPAITGARTPAANAAGWNDTAVTVSFTCTDSGSGIAVAGCTAPVVVPEGANQSVTGTAVDEAGNTATATVAGINVDTAPPSLAGSPTTAPNANGWYNAPVTIGWACADALSGILGPCPADSVIGAEGMGLTVAQSVSDVAGNTTSASSPPVKIDRTAPSTSASAVPNWSNTAVTVTLGATDALSGVEATHFSVDGGPVQSGASVVIGDEGEHTLDFWSVDNAGNVESASTLAVRVDLSAPSITVSQAPAPNAGGWNNGDVTVTFTCADPTSGIASCTAPQTVSAEGAGQTVSGTAVDNAGNTASASHTVNIDKTAPTIAAVVPAPNANGWHNAPVTVAWSCADALSGVESCPDAETLSNDGAAQSASGTATDVAGNTATASVSGINIDQTPPTLTPSAPPTSSGWYAGPVTVHWECADDLSGVTSCPADQVVTDEGFTTLAETVTDHAGNTTTVDITIRIDKTPPVIVGSATPAPNAHGWNNTDVNVSFACSDSLSGIASCSGPTTLGEGENQSVTGQATDSAGNAAESTVNGVNVDKTAPTLSAAPTTAPNVNGWYNAAVTIDWTCDDQLSGIDTATCPDDSLVTTEGHDQQVTRTVFDLAGNATTAASPPIDVDLTAPVTSASAVPTAFTNTDVTVSLNATDNLSGVAETRYAIDGGPTVVGTNVTFTSDGVHTLGYFSVDAAGNVETQHTVVVRIDRTAPAIESAQTPAANLAGWNNTNVDVTFTCADTLSGIASCTGPQSVTTDGAGQAVSGTAVDNAGNSASTTRFVSVDKTPPAIASTLSSAPNAFGWFRVPVSAAFTCSDALSGVASCSAPVTFGEGASQFATGAASDVAGNNATTTAGPVNVDVTAPTITATPDRAPDNGTFYSGPVTVHFTCTDALSGIAAGSCPADVVVSNDGTTTVTGTTTDRAGNTATATATITITIQSLRAQKQKVLIQISAAHTAASKYDAPRLKVARDAVAASIDPALWGEGNRLQVHGGVKVFEKEKQAVEKLTEMRADPRTQVPGATLLGWIDVLTEADRTLARTAIDDAIASSGDPAKIADAQADLAAGDLKRSAGSDGLAIEDYKNAWMKALQAVGKEPTLT